MTSQSTLSLSIDIYHLIFGFLNISDILVLRRTCKDFYELSVLRSVWETLLQKHVIKQSIPVPGLNGNSLCSLTSTELEECYKKAMALRRNWVSPSPRVQKQFTLDAVPHSRIISMQVLPGHSSRRLVSLSLSGGRQRVFTLQCWDIGARTSPICLARRQLLNFRGFAANRIESSNKTIAIMNPDLQILSVDPEAADPDNGFVTEASIPQVQDAGLIHLFVNSHLLTRSSNGALHLWNLNSLNIKYELQNPDLVSQPTPVVDVLVTDELIVVLGSSTLEIYCRPPEMPPPGGASSNRNALLAIPVMPVSVFKWPWGIDNAVMALVHRPDSRQRQRRAPIDILVRFRSYYPWALNILHHYTLYPNLQFLSENPISEHNPPYQMPPMLRKSIASPVRLHATSDMAIGPYGTAIWTDSHTEDYFNHADRGQRIAGMLSRHIVNDEGEEEIELSDQVATAAATSVYSYHEEDTWVRIALDEAEGRIFVGRDDGVISVFEYI